MINWIRNVFYDKNDIFVALLIIVLAAFIIKGRIDVIMGYPEALAAETNFLSAQGSDSGNGSGSSNPDDSLTTADSGTQGGEDGENGGVAGEEDGQAEGGSNQSEGGGDPVIGAVYIQNGDTAAAIAQKLVDGGFVSTRDEFLSAVESANAYTRLKAGNFMVPMGSTPEQIVEILTSN